MSKRNSGYRYMVQSSNLKTLMEESGAAKAAQTTLLPTALSGSLCSRSLSSDIL